ncbi:hypothetical protein ACFL0E_00465, partial [Nanoarchaeota archaeon]
SESIFKESKAYKWDLACTCFNSSESTSLNPGHCYNSSGTSIKTFANGESQYPFNIIDVGDKMIINASYNSTHPGIWVENEYSNRVNITPSLPTLWQEDIDWNDYAGADGQAFLTAGEKFRVCVRANNTFDGDEHIIFDHLHLIRKTASEVFVFRKDGSYLEDNEFLHIEIKSHEETGLTYQKCSDWLLSPSYIKGQNNWKVAFNIVVEGYDQEVELNSDRFTIFGERRDKDYIDYLTLNDVNFTYDNATEGEYVQLQLNITNNHPTKDVKLRSIYQLYSNWNLTVSSSRNIDVTPYSLKDYINPDESSFTIEGVFPKNYTSISNSPRFKVPYNLKNQDMYDIIAGTTTLYFGNNYEYEIKWPTTNNPTIDISYYDYEITNLSTTISNTQTSSCSPITIQTTYNDLVSHTNATTEEDQHYILRGCFEDTTNDYYFDCVNIELQPDHGESQTWNFTTTLPYVSSTVESEIDVWVYTYDSTNTDEQCYHCGEEVFAFSGDEGDATFNISTTLTDECKYSKRSIVGEDDDMYLSWRMTDSLNNLTYSNQRQAEALEGVENKTGTFHLAVDCPSWGHISSELPCVITAQIEDSQIVQKEVDFTCYITNGSSTYSSLNFNQMVTRSRVILNRNFVIPSSLIESNQYILQCHADYYNLGSRRDSFYDTFTAVSPTSPTGPLKEASSTEKNISEEVIEKIPSPENISTPEITGRVVEEVKLIDAGEKIKKTLLRFSIIDYLFGLVIILLVISIIFLATRKRERKEKKKIKKHRRKYNLKFKITKLHKKIFLIAILTILVLSLFAGCFYKYNLMKNKQNNLFKIQQQRDSDNLMCYNSSKYMAGEHGYFVKDRMFRGIIISFFVILMIILLFKALNIQLELKIGKNTSSGKRSRIKIRRKKRK